MGNDHNNNNSNNDGDLLVFTGTTSLGSPFKPAKRNVLETQRRMSRRASGIAFDLVQAQNDAILKQEMELADKKAEMYARLNARLKHRQFLDDVLASSEEEDNNDLSSDVDVASVETASADGSIKDVAVVTKVVQRKKKVKGKVSQKRKTKVVFNRNRQKTKMTNGSRKSKALRKTRTTKGTTNSISVAHLKKQMMSEPIHEDEDDDEDDDNDDNENGGGSHRSVSDLYYKGFDSNSDDEDN